MRLTSSATNSTAVDAKLFIGPKESTFSVTTADVVSAVAPEIVDNFDFSNKDGVALDSDITSDGIPVTVKNGPVKIKVSG